MRVCSKRSMLCIDETLYDCAGRLFLITATGMGRIDGIGTVQQLWP